MYEVKAVDNRIWMKLSGNIDAEKAAEIAETLRCLVASGLAIFVVDLSDVGFIERVGLEFLLDVQERVRLRGGCVVIKGLNGTGWQRGESAGAKNQIACE